MALTFPRGASVALATLSRPSKGIYLLSMHNTSNGLMDNRLTPEFIKHSLLPALDEVELSFRRDYARGDKDAALVITGERTKNKFFSNGLSLDLVTECPGFFKDYYYLLMSRLLTFPMCTVAALNGHTYAGGFCLAQCTDWRVMKAERAWACMNEINFGAPLPNGMAAILKQRLTPGTLRKVMLTAHQFTGPEALDAGIVDEIVQGDGEKVIERALEIAQANIKHSASGVMHMIKETLYAEVTKGLLGNDVMQSPDALNANRLKVLSEAAISSRL